MGLLQLLLLYVLGVVGRPTMDGDFDSRAFRELGFVVDDVSVHLPSGSVFVSGCPTVLEV